MVIKKTKTIVSPVAISGKLTFAFHKEFLSTENNSFQFATDEGGGELANRRWT
jgi:hypothetical protein